MKRQLYILGGTLFTLFLSGCSNGTLPLPEEEGERIPITFSASGVSVGTEVQTKADTKAFPHGGSIAIVAAHATQSTPDWSNLFMNHVKATANTTTDADNYIVTTDDNTTYYWPFNPTEYLSFAAYSPAINGSGNESVSKTSGKNTALDVKTPFPDLLYSSHTDCWNKSHGTVALTQFQHAMAKVKVIVKCVKYNNENAEIDYSNADITISSLSIGTKVTTGKFDFQAPAWTLQTPAGDAIATTLYTLITGGSSKMTKAYESTGDYYLLPNTTSTNVADNSVINITLKDKSGSYPYTKNISDFKVSGGGNASLVMGKITTLTIKIKVMDVESGSTDGIVLKGDLTDWVDKGNSTVVIE